MCHASTQAEQIVISLITFSFKYSNNSAQTILLGWAPWRYLVGSQWGRQLWSLHYRVLQKWTIPGLLVHISPHDTIKWIILFILLKLYLWKEFHSWCNDGIFFLLIYVLQLFSCCWFKKNNLHFTKKIVPVSMIFSVVTFVIMRECVLNWYVVQRFHLCLRMALPSPRKATMIGLVLWGSTATLHSLPTRMLTCTATLKVPSDLWPTPCPWRRLMHSVGQQPQQR